MATFSRIKVWVSNEVLTAADLNAEFDNIINNMTPSGVEDASANVAAMQTTTNPGGVGTESLATSLLGEIQRLRYVAARFVDSALGSEWYEAPGRSFAAGDLNVETADIETAAVTQPKLGPKNFTLSASSGSFGTTSSSFVDVTNLSASITTNGRPVRVELIPNLGSQTVFGVAATGAATVVAAAEFRFVRDATTLATNEFAGFCLNDLDRVSGAPFCFEEDIAAGTYVYKLQARVVSLATTAQVGNYRLRVTEL